jgi:hypothetical protein
MAGIILAAQKILMKDSKIIKGAARILQKDLEE